MTFVQTPPQFGNPFHSDRVLRPYPARTLPPDMLADIQPALVHMGELAGSEIYRFRLADRASEPVHVPWDAWGHRIDHIDVSPLWREAGYILQGVREPVPLLRHAQWALEYEQDARHFAAEGVNRLADVRAEDAPILASNTNH